MSEKKMSDKNKKFVQPTPDQVGMMRFKRLAPRPTRLEETGLSITFLSDLIAKHLLDRGTSSLAELARRVTLTGSILETVLDFMRSEALVEVRPNRADHPGLHYALTDRGRCAALDAMQRNGYVGPAPVPLKHCSLAQRLRCASNWSTAAPADR